MLIQSMREIGFKRIEEVEHMVTVGAKVCIIFLKCIPVAVLMLLEYLGLTDIFASPHCFDDIIAIRVTLA